MNAQLVLITATKMQRALIQEMIFFVNVRLGTWEMGLIAKVSIRLIDKRVNHSINTSMKNALL